MGSNADGAGLGGTILGPGSTGSWAASGSRLLKDVGPGGGDGDKARIRAVLQRLEALIGKEDQAAWNEVWNQIEELKRVADSTTPGSPLYQLVEAYNYGAMATWEHLRKQYEVRQPTPEERAESERRINEFQERLKRDQALQAERLRQYHESNMQRVRELEEEADRQDRRDERWRRRQTVRKDRWGQLRFWIYTVLGGASRYEAIREIWY